MIVLFGIRIRNKEDMMRTKAMKHFKKRKGWKIFGGGDHYGR